MSHRRTPWMTLLATAALLACGPLGAAQAQPAPEVVVGAMATKLLRGLVNVITCPLELPRQIDRHVAERGAWEGAWVGLVAGVGMTAFRGVAGALEAATFLMPAPDNYGPLCRPALVWHDWDAFAPHSQDAQAEAAP